MEKLSFWINTKIITLKKHILFSALSLISFLSYQLKAQQLHNLQPYELIERQYINLQHTEKVAALQVQGFQGRIKPINTLALELLRKIYGKNSYSYIDKNNQKRQLTPTQVFIGMQYKPDSWQLLECIKIEKKAIKELKELITINANGYTSASQFFNFEGTYKLKPLVTQAYAKAPGKRSVFDKDIIKIDERINIIWGIFNGQFFKIFPKIDDPSLTWYAPSDTDIIFNPDDQLFFEKIIPTYFANLDIGITTKDWKKADETVELLSQFQQKNGNDIVIHKTKIDLEIWLNNNPLILWCLIGYSCLGVLLLLFSFLEVFTSNKKLLNSIVLGCTIIIFTIFITHGISIGLRWYISGHKSSSFAPAASAILATCLIGIAQGSLMNPEITNLVPVLKSYWLLIHVAIITGSYGFLALGSLLSLIALIMMSVQNNANATTTNNVIQKLTHINQLTSTIGLYMLTIGTFLGGIWANESWGRYWGWDPKETWALISIIIYSFVLHIRIIIPKNYIYFYNVCSLFALGSLIMTFFGVNYYLSGLHSYAKGDPFPIPYWIYIIIPIAFIICIIPIVRSRLSNRKTNIPNLV